MADLSHLGWPYRLGVDVEEFSSDELMGSAAVIACTPRGQRDDDPEFGVTPLVFDRRPLDTDRLAAELAQSDPRLDQLTAQEVGAITDTVATVRVDIGGRVRA